MQAALAAIPGVVSVTAANILPLGGLFFPNRWGKEDALNDFSKFQSADLQVGFRIFRRHAHAADRGPGAGCEGVSQWRRGGSKILSRINTDTNVWYEIVGVVAHQRLTSLAEPGREQMYVTNGSLN
jgi:hypothetical protein